jgi:acyl-CoA synthetase (AMP-forming)/AMP-acid ligase II
VLDYPGIEDCALIYRSDDTRSAIAYVVSRTSISADAIRDHLRASGVETILADVVRVSAIPLTDDGRTDESALATLDVAGAPDQEIRVDRLLPIAPRSVNGHHARTGGDVPAVSAVPALSVAEPIAWHGGRPATLADLLLRAAQLAPDHTLTCVDAGREHVFSYVELLDRARRVMSGLRTAGLRAGDKIILQLDQNDQFIVAFWACALGGFVPAPLAVPVTMDPAGAAATKLKNSWRLLGEPRVLTSEAARPMLAELCAGLTIAGLELLTIEQALESEPASGIHPSAEDDLALLLLTSGSTGVPKAVMQTHGALVAGCTGMAQRNSFSSRDVLVNWIALDHVGGLVMSHLLFVTLAGRQVHARTDVVLQDPLRWLDLIDRHRATYTWAPNFAYALVNDRASEMAARRWDLSSMAFILNGGEAVVAPTAARFMRLLAPFGLPVTAMRPAWGMSETCSAATFSGPLLADAPGQPDGLVDVGPPNPGGEIRIVDDRGAVLPEGVSGRLEIRGRNVTRGYFNNSEANAESFTADGWFRTGDLGRLSGGSLTITGREKGVIIINGANYHAHEVEAAAESVAGVTPAFAAAFAVRDAGADTDALAVAFHTTDQDEASLAELVRRIRAAVLERAGAVPSYILPVAKHEIPKTDIGKIQRLALTKRFESGGFDAVVQRIAQLTERAETVPDWFFRPVWRRRQAETHRPVGPGTVVVLVSEPGIFPSAIEAAIAGTGARCVVSSLHGVAQHLAATSASDRVVILYGARHGRRPVASGVDEPHFVEDAIVELSSLVQTVAASSQRTSRCELIAYDDGVHHVVDGDRVVAGKASLIALLRTSAAEHPELATRHVDSGLATPGAIATMLLAEIADRRDEPEVAYRAGERWVRRLAKSAPIATVSGHRFGSAKGFYLVTGGAGGIGVEICRALRQATNAPLLLIGRSTHPEGRQSLDDVHYEAVDVADQEALDRTVSTAAARLALPLAGIIHLAGTFSPRLIADETAETLRAALRAKVQGTWSLHRLLLRHPEAVFVAFSSVNGHLGGYSAGAYAAANAFVDSVVEHNVVELGRRAYSFGWSLWDGVGLSRIYAHRESAERRGYRAISPRHGVLSCLAAVGSQPGHSLIGLDGRHPQIARFVDGPAHRSPASESTVQVKTPAAPMTMSSDLERSIAAIWRTVLPAREFGPDDNFFDVGGNSVLVAKASRALQQALGRDIAITDLYRFPTLRLLAAHYGGHDTDAVDLDGSEERGQSRRARRLQRSRREL